MDEEVSLKKVLEFVFSMDYYQIFTESNRQFTYIYLKRVILQMRKKLRRKRYVKLLVMMTKKSKPWIGVLNAK